MSLSSANATTAPAATLTVSEIVGDSASRTVMRASSTPPTSTCTAVVVPMPEQPDMSPACACASIWMTPVVGIVSSNCGSGSPRSFGPGCQKIVSPAGIENCEL